MGIDFMQMLPLQQQGEQSEPPALPAVSVQKERLLGAFRRYNDREALNEGDMVVFKDELAPITGDAATQPMIVIRWLDMSDDYDKWIDQFCRSRGMLLTDPVDIMVGRVMREHGVVISPTCSALLRKVAPEGDEL